MNIKAGSFFMSMKSKMCIMLLCTVVMLTGCRESSPEDRVRDAFQALSRQDYQKMLEVTTGSMLKRTIATEAKKYPLQSLRYRLLRISDKYRPDNLHFLRAKYRRGGIQVICTFTVKWISGKSNKYLRYNWVMRREKGGWRFASVL